jgi:hypothetical protein
MSDLPKLEGLINVTTAYTISVTDSGGTDAAITIPVDEYYLTSTRQTPLLTTLQTALNASATLAGTYTVSLSDTNESATGKVTISSTHTYSLTWTSTTLRDILGWTGNISSVTSATGTNHARYLWLPNCARTGSVPEPVSGSSCFGKPKTDVTTTMAPSGVYTALYYNTVHRAVLDFQFIQGNKAWQRLESTTNESLEKFYRDVVGQGVRLAYFPDRATDADSWELWTPSGGELVCTPLDQTYVGTGSLWSWAAEVYDYVAP